MTMIGHSIDVKGNGNTSLSLNVLVRLKSRTATNRTYLRPCTRQSIGVLIMSLCYRRWREENMYYV